MPVAILAQAPRPARTPQTQPDPARANEFAGMAWTNLRADRHRVLRPDARAADLPELPEAIH